MDADCAYADTKVLISMKRIYYFYWLFMGVFFKQAWCSERAELLFIPGRALPERVLGGHQHQNAVPIPRCAVFRRSRKHLRVLVLGMRWGENFELSFGFSKWFERFYMYFSMQVSPRFSLKHRYFLYAASHTKDGEKRKRLDINTLRLHSYGLFAWCKSLAYDLCKH